MAFYPEKGNPLKEQVPGPQVALGIYLTRIKKCKIRFCRYDFGLT